MLKILKRSSTLSNGEEVNFNNSTFTGTYKRVSCDGMNEMLQALGTGALSRHIRTQSKASATIRLEESCGDWLLEETIADRTGSLKFRIGEPYLQLHSNGDMTQNKVTREPYLQLHSNGDMTQNKVTREDMDTLVFTSNPGQQVPTTPRCDTHILEFSGETMTRTTVVTVYTWAQGVKQVNIVETFNKINKKPAPIKEREDLC